MYIVDSNMTETTCKELAIKYVEYLDNNKLISTFPEQTYVYNTKSQSLTIHTRDNPLPASDVNISSMEHVTFGATASLLLTRAFKFKGKGTRNAKVIASVVCIAIGCGVGCVIEQMLFPPQYSERMQEYLSKETNWHIISTYRKPSRMF